MWHTTCCKNYSGLQMEGSPQSSGGSPVRGMGRREVWSHKKMGVATEQKHTYSDLGLSAISGTILTVVDSTPFAGIVYIDLAHCRES